MDGPLGLMVIVGFIIIVGTVGAIALWGPKRVPVRYTRLLQTLVETTPIRYGNAPGGGKYQILLPEQASLVWHDLIFGIYEKDLALFDPETTRAQRFAFNDLEFVSPPTESIGGMQTTLHYNVDNKWCIIHLKMQQQDMIAFQAHFGNYVPNDVPIVESVIVHHGPAQHAEQDIHGVWTFGSSLYIYLFPHLLVSLSGSAVHTRIPIRAIDRVLSIERLDEEREGLLDFLLQGGESGVVRVHYQGNILTFAHKSYEQFAHEIAETANCKYEHISRKAKKSDSKSAW